MRAIRVIPGYLLRILCRFSLHSFYRVIRKIDGSFQFRGRWWVDTQFLEDRLPQDTFKLLKSRSILLSEIGKKRIKTLSPLDKQRLMSMMLTCKEVSILTRIPRNFLLRACLIGQIKTVELGGETFIPRTEIERICGCIWDDEKVMRVCETSQSLRKRVSR